MFLILSAMACRATIAVQAPQSTEVYITKQSRPMENKKPSVYECKGKSQTTCEVKYFAWTKYYYGVYANDWTEIGQVQGEVKWGAVAATLLLFQPSIIWTWGPSEDPIYIHPPE